MDAVPAPVVLRDAETADVALRTIACDEESRLLLEGELRDQVVEPGLQGKFGSTKIVRVV